MDLITAPETMAKITAAWFDADGQRWLGAGDRWLCTAQDNPDACEDHEKHCRVLWTQKVGEVDYSLRWDPTWGQLVVMELGFVCWFGFPRTAQVTEEDLLTGFQELQNAILDAWRNSQVDEDDE